MQEDQELLQEAQDPSTSAERLAALVQEPEEIARAAMKNPNIGRESLFQYAHKFPREFAQNPALPLFLLEKSDPNELKAKALKTILQDPSIEVELVKTLVGIASLRIQKQLATSKLPEAALQALAQIEHPEILRALASNAATPAAMLWAFSKEDELQPALAQTPYTPIELLRALAKEPTLREIIAKNPSTSAALLEELWRFSDNPLATQCALAQNPKTPTHCVAQLALHNELHEDIARNPNTPVSLLSTLATNIKPGVRRAVAENPSAPIELLVKLASDKSFAVIEGALRNPNTPSSILLRYADEPALQPALSQNPNSPPTLLERLSDSPRDKIKLNVARNPKTPLHVRYKLSKDSSYETSTAATDRVSAPLELLSMDRTLQQIRALPRESYTPEVIEFLANDQSSEARTSAVAGATAALLTRLASDESAAVRGVVARHEETPEEALRIVLQGGDIEVLQRLAANPKAPYEILLALANHSEPYYHENLAHNPKLTPELAEIIAKGREYYAIRCIASSEALPLRWLEALAFDPALEVQPQIAANPRAPDTLLMRFPEDVGPDIARREPPPSFIIERAFQRDDAALLSVLARNPTTPREILAELAAKAHPDILAGLLLNPNTPTSIKEKITLNTKLRRALLTYRDIPGELLLSISDDPAVYPQLAARGELPIEILRRLLATNSTSILEALASSQTPPEIEQALAGCPESSVRERLAFSTQLASESLRLLVSAPLSRAARIRLAASQNLSIDAMRELIADPELRSHIARRSSTPSEILDLLIDEPSISVRCYLAANPSTSRASLWLLSTDPELFVQRLVAENPSADPALLATLAAHPERFVRLGAMKNQSTPDEALASTKDPEEQESLRLRARARAFSRLIAG